MPEDDRPPAAVPANPLLHTPSRPLPRSVAIVGAGTIGPDIGYYLKSAIPDLRLLLVDIVPAALDRAVERIRKNADRGVRKGKLSEERAAAIAAGITTTTDYDDVAGCDWVLEAATENIELKRDIFDRIEAVVRTDAAITSNTSSLPAARLFERLAHPERATVTHFFAPAFRNPVVEVIEWAGADPALIEHLRWVLASTGKVPMVTADAICFMLDRVFDNWCNEAAWLLDRFTAREIDAVAAELVHAGPFQVLNLAHGNPIIVETNRLQMQQEGEHYRPAPIFGSVETWATLGPGERLEVEPERAAAIRDRLLGILFSQSADIVDRDIGSRADLELGAVLALGFRRGPFDRMRELGELETGRIMARLGEERPGLPQPRRPLADYLDFRRHVLVDQRDGVVVLTLRRPQARNALDDRVTDEILACLEEREADPGVVGFVLTGYGDRAFSAGADIGRFPEVLGMAKEAAAYARHCARLLVHLDAMTKPVVAALNGLTLGGGLELAIRCHQLVASRGAILQFPEVTLGIAPGLGGMVVPYRRWPEAAAVFDEMLLGARRLGAVEAHERGIVAALADDVPGLVAVAAGRVRELGGRLPRIPDPPVPRERPATGDPIAADGRRLSREVRAIIADAIAHAAAADGLAAALEIGYQAFGADACTAAAREGVEAFLGGRKPDFDRTG